MNKTEQFLNLIEFKGGHITLAEIMNLPEYRVEYRRMFTELRKKGWTVSCERDREHPGQNRYILMSPMRFESNGQRTFA